MYSIAEEDAACDNTPDNTVTNNGKQSVTFIAGFIVDIRTRRSTPTAVAPNAQPTEVVEVASRVLPGTASMLATTQPVRVLEGSVHVITRHREEGPTVQRLIQMKRTSAPTKRTIDPIKGGNLITVALAFPVPRYFLDTARTEV